MAKCVSRGKITYIITTACPAVVSVVQKTIRMVQGYVVVHSAPWMNAKCVILIIT